MIFDELVLRDFGSFAGRQVLDLTPRQQRPVVVIGALNGSGKTTVLEALQLALYGPHTSASARRGASYETYLASMVHRGADPRAGAGVELAFRGHFRNRPHDLRVRRRWWMADSGKQKEHLQVLVDGNVDEQLSNSWAEHVEQLVPRGISGLFFFDGEQIEAFADLEASRELLETAVSGLLGLELIDRLVDDLELLERRKRNAAVPPDDQAQVQTLTELLEQARAEESRARAGVDEARRRLGAARSDVTDAERQLDIDGGAAMEARTSREQAAAAAAADVAAAEHRLLDAAAGLAPLLLVPELVTDVATLTQAERRYEQEQALTGQLARRDEQLLQHLAKVFDRDQIRTVREWLDRDSRARQQPPPPLMLHCGGDVATQAQHLSDGGLQELRSELAELTASVDTAAERQQQARTALEAVPSPDQMAVLMARRDAARQAAHQAEADVHQAEEALRRTRHARERAEARRDSALVQLSRERLAAEDAGRLVRTSHRARDTLRQLRQAATARHSHRIESCVLEAAHALLRKPDLITAVRIDPGTHRLSLLDSGGRLLRPSSLSAGERQLLAVSLLWGLARAAGRPLPIVIDTPLGRLDGPHRQRLLERYLPAASHQVIVLSTDTEVDLRAIRRLEPNLSHVLHLDHDLAAHATVVREGCVQGSVA